MQLLGHSTSVEQVLTYFALVQLTRKWIIFHLVSVYFLFYCWVNSIHLGSLDAVTKEKKLLFLSLYFLIWGEAANIRFLPECLCYIFHHVQLPHRSHYHFLFMGSIWVITIWIISDAQMAREMDEILRQQVAQRANSCNSENGASFLNKVIAPLYEVVAAVCLLFHCTSSSLQKWYQHHI